MLIWQDDLSLCETLQSANAASKAGNGILEQSWTKKTKNGSCACCLVVLWRQAVSMSPAPWAPHQVLSHQMQSEYAVGNMRRSASKVIRILIDIPWITHKLIILFFFALPFHYEEVCRQEAQIIQTHTDPSSVLKKENIGTLFSDDWIRILFTDRSL